MLTFRPSEDAKRLHALYAADFDGVGSLWGIRNLKADLVTLLKFVELYVHELVGVEKEILFLTFDFDEPESLVGETSNSSCLHSNKNLFL